MRYFFSILSILFFTLLSCDEDKEELEVVMPANLRAEISVSEETEGLVDIEAQAILANYFSFTFYDNEEEVIVESEEGKASYTFTESGIYKIVVKAHATASQFISLEDSVEIEIIPNLSVIPSIDSGYISPLSYAGYNLVWQDEFNSTQLSGDWNYEIGGGGWGNNELQYYRSENTEVRDGMLVITAKKENFGGRAYTSSRLTTQNKQSFKYGRIDIRAALPQGQGMWPALWMLGDSFSSVGWPKCGEIDIMEMVGGERSGARGDGVVHGTLHWWQDDQSVKADFGSSYALPNGEALAEEFHVYTIEWDENSIQWYIDDLRFHTMTISGNNLTEFREKFFFIFNIAVGGTWPGSPNSDTQFPQYMAVDYVRVFQ